MVPAFNDLNEEAEGHFYILAGRTMPMLAEFKKDPSGDPEHNKYVLCEDGAMIGPLLYGAGLHVAPPGIGKFEIYAPIMPGSIDKFNGPTAYKKIGEVDYIEKNIEAFNLVELPNEGSDSDMVQYGRLAFTDFKEKVLVTQDTNRYYHFMKDGSFESTISGREDADMADAYKLIHSQELPVFADVLIALTKKIGHDKIFVRYVNGEDTPYGITISTVDLGKRGARTKIYASRITDYLE